MQITLANETLAKCIGNVDGVKNKLSPKNSSRHQRMNAFLRFIMKDDHNVIEFARVLENNGLEELLRCKHDVHGRNIPVQDIGKLCEQQSALYVKYDMIVRLNSEMN